MTRHLQGLLLTLECACESHGSFDDAGSNSLGLGVQATIYIFIELPGDVSAAGPWVSL